MAPWLDFSLFWALLSVSLFNTVILLWLGLTVLLNAERRHIGVWVAGFGLLAGGAFFAAHSVMLDYSLRALVFGVRVWWYGGWSAILVLPCAWYLLMLWYAGFWDEKTSTLRRRHRPCLLLVSTLLTVLFIVVALANPFRVLAQMANVPSHDALSLRGWPYLLVLYPVYLLMCIGLALDVLRRPNVSGRALRDVARQRARPYLIASTLVQLGLSLLVGLAILGMVYASLWGRVPDAIAGRIELWGSALELLVCALIALAVILLGKAIVSYGILTEKTLPRRGFVRQWRVIVIVAAVYSALVGLSQGFELRPIYPLMLTTILMSAFLAFFAWRSYAEQEQHTSNLRAVAGSQHFYDDLLSRHRENSGENSTQENAAHDSFATLCRDVLHARRAFLQPLGSLAPLVAAETFPPSLSVPNVQSLAMSFSPQTRCVPLDATIYHGAIWAVPLWGERGLIGALLLGEKEDGGLYTQEEIEVARAAGERSIDARAGRALSQRLMSLQRQRLAENQLLDRQARRALHDEILPRVHAAILTLSASGNAEVLTQLSDVHRQISDLLREMPTHTTPEIARLGVLGSLHRVLETEWKGAFDGVTWDVEDDVEKRFQSLHPLTGEVLFFACREAIRNAARYGRGDDPTRLLQLTLRATEDESLHIEIEDDGVGTSAIEYSKDTEKSNGGSGRGLTLHSTMMAIVGGTLSVESQTGRGMRVRLTLPPEDLSVVVPATE